MENAAVRKHKVGNVFAVIAIISCILIILGFLYSMTALLWVTCIVNFIAGPACLIGYLNEVRKGVFANDEEYENDIMKEAEDA